MTHPAVEWTFPWFATPNSPDLGCFKENKHEFEVDFSGGIMAGFWMEFPPWEFVNGAPQYIPHQVYYRIKCGDAAFYQRIQAWMTPDGWIPPQFMNTPPDSGVGGEHRPTPGDWVKFSVQSGPKDYWFLGEHRNPDGGTWARDAAVGHSFDLYDNGTLSTVGWDDTGGDLDYNDVIMEVAVVYRRGYFDWLHPAAIDEATLSRFVQEGYPKYRASRVPPGTK